MLSEKEYTTKYIIFRVLKNHVRPHLKQILIALMFMIIVACCSATIVFLTGPTTNQFFVAKNRKMLIILSMAMIFVSSTKGIAEYGQDYIIKYIGQRILTDVQILLYKNLLKTDVSFIQQKSSGRLISHFTNDIILMRTAVSSFLIGTAKHLLTIIFIIIMMFYRESHLSIIIFIIFPSVVLPIQILSKKLRRNIDLTQTLLANYAAKLDETFQSIKIIKSFATEEYEIKKATEKSEEILTYYRKSAKLDALIGPIMEIFSGLAIGGIIWYGGMLVIDGTTTPGSLISFLVAFVSVYRPFKSLMVLNNHLQEGIAAAKRLFAIIDIEPTIKDSENAISISLISPPQIRFEKVTLKINDTPILNDISFTAEPGKIIAIVGRSGSGKTSIINLLLRFIQLESGNIYINNININDASLVSLRKNIAFITQETILLDNSVANNISYGSNASMIDITDSAMRAAAHEFIMQLPYGYDTNLGTQGMILSGGQKQRIGKSIT